MSANVSKRLSFWFTYNLGFALFPLIASITLHYLAGRSLYVALTKSPEILFFAIMTTATALGDITEVSPTADLEVGARFFRFVLMLGAIVSTFLYGVLLHESIIGPSSEGVHVRLLNISVPLAIIYFGIGTLVEVLVGTIEDNRSSNS